MWYLTSKEDQRVIYITGKTTEITIGRTPDAQQTNCFVIPDDASISRKHATLSLNNMELYIQDLGSRYGTFVNTDYRLESNAIKLNENDIVKFGKMGSIWKVHKKSFITCTSTLKGENLQNLMQCLSDLSGSLKSEWDDNCKFLTMPAITITMKVVLALVQGAHIVTIDYWNKCLEAVKNQTALPDPSRYTPQVIESTLNKEVVSFVPDNERQKLFSGKKVVFFSKQKYDLYKVVLTKASATPLLLSESKMTKSMLCEKDIIVIQCNIPAASQETQSQRDSILEIVNYMKSRGKRLITDVEIGLAVLYCSIEKYCNPTFNFPSEVIKQTGQNSNSGTVLAQESQEPTQRIGHQKENIVINESITSSNMSKRKMSEEDSDFQENSHKKFAVDHTKTNGGIKRKVMEQNSDAELNPSKKHASGGFDNDDGFDFVNNVNSNMESGSSMKKLNLTKPQKRKLDGDDDDDLFQFVQDKQKDLEGTSKTNTFGVKNIKLEPKNDDYKTDANNVDISTLRGAKLEELMKNNEKLMNNKNVDLKKEIKEELDEKMGNLSLGTTIVKIRSDLVVKKEPIHIQEQSSEVKNFKKFKKVWPVKMQVTLIPKSSMNTFKLQNNATMEQTSYYTDNDEKNNITIPDSEDKNDGMIQDSEVF